ncbi:ribulose-phosphate 3-epimerase [Silurus asotus]|uniref:Ribulose-phosphate 3-epimerase n=1 Tax=Silurus asotus TaxID=30991 RepID=A0AAD5FQF5_SILAS|nr:ribulose-phosphate 3-epimerase [Silurus asotus]
MLMPLCKKRAELIESFGQALERQKEYSDIIQDERDALRNEVFRLRDALKKHGISLGSEVTTNGETGNNMTNGPECVESAQDGPAMSADSILDMHMMVSRPEQWVKPMAAAGASQYTFHLEATTNPGSLIKDIRESGMKVWEGFKFLGCFLT